MLTALIKNAATHVSARARKRRAELFRSLFDIEGVTTILDLGSEDGSYIREVLEGTKVKPENVWIADISESAGPPGSHKFNTVTINEEGPLPFANKQFDIVFCSSVIEHVTGLKADVWNERNGKEFRRRADRLQMEFANEIRRIGKGYFVQTPNRYFVIESHTWLPFVGYASRPVMVDLIAAFNRFWVKQSIPDFQLLNIRDMQRLFPGSRIVLERKLGMVKSIMAVKTEGEN